jgi:hypothetical protein
VPNLRFGDSQLLPVSGSFSGGQTSEKRRWFQFY